MSADAIRLNEDLFKLGFADPRGCEYRVITVTIGSQRTGDGGVLATCGWVLPPDPKSPQRFAVCWNGLVYPVIKVGPPADLAVDVKAASKAAREFRRQEWAHDGVKGPSEPEGRSIWRSSIGSRDPLLLRLGETELFNFNFGSAPQNEVAPDEAIASWAVMWISTLFDRALCAQMRSDDQLALHDYRLLTKLRPQIEARLPKQQNEWYSLGFLKQLPHLLADQERRVHSPRRHADVVCRGPGKSPDSVKRIAALIECLDEVAASDGDSFPEMEHDPIVQALIGEGEAAREPLLACIEQDTRLTRTVSFPSRRYISNERSVYSVHSAARTAIAVILRDAGFELTSVAGEAPFEPNTAKEWAEHYRRYQKKGDRLPLAPRLSLAETYFRVLANDAAAEKWPHAANMLMSPEHVARVGAFVVNAAPPKKKKDADRIIAEALRDRRDPSLSDLLVRRIGQTKDLTTATYLTVQLAKWDAKAAQRIVLPLIRRAREAGDERSFLELVAASNGHSEALDIYADWLRTFKRPSQDDDFNWGNALYPLRDHHSHPKAAAASDWLFNDPASPWVPFLRPEKKSGFASWLDLYEFSFVEIPAVRKSFIRDLADKRYIGTVKYDARGYPSVEIPGITSYWSSSEGLHRDATLPPAGIEASFRVCDWVAYKMSEQIAAAPRCELWWDEARRDQAAADCRVFLERFGERLLHGYGVVTFPQLGRPATEAEARRGEAVFSLSGEVRGVPKKFPVHARWLALKDHPYYVTKTKSAVGSTELIYENQGAIWQAEEVRENGNWRRYYGFVGSHRIERVAAEELEFPPPSGTWREPEPHEWIELAPSLHARLHGWWDEYELGEGECARRSTDEVLPIVVELWNSRGLDRPAGNLVELLALRVDHSRETVSRQGLLVPTGDWKPVAFRQPIAWKSLPASLPAGESVRFAPINLRDWLDLSQNGFYQVSLGGARLRFSQAIR